jgi:hypothetical protein
VRIHLDGLPAPALQRVIGDANGEIIGRVDFVWEEHRTIGEFDGQGKYNELRGNGDSKADVVAAEKRREDRMRDAGWAIARWEWADLYADGVVRDRIVRAFRRAGYPLLTLHTPRHRTS